MRDVSLGAQHRNRRAVDAHASIDDELFTGAARAKARACKDFLKAFFSGCLGLGLHEGLVSRLGPLRNAPQ